MVLRIHGDMASDMKSLMEVFTNVKPATMLHLYHESSTTPMNLAVEDGPNVMKDVSSNPISLKRLMTMISQTMSTVTASRLSSKIRSMMDMRHIFGSD